jgi:predicted secreted protein
MATVDPKYGKDLILKVGSGTATQITNLLTNGISKGRDTRDVTTKSSTGNWKEIRVTYKNAEISFEGLYTEEDTGVNTYGDLEALWNAGTEIDWEYGSGVIGDRKESGKGYILSLDREDSQEGNSTFSGKINVTGEITVGAYAAP